MKAILGTKKGMTSIFDAEGVNTPVTVIEAGPCVVTQVKTEEVDGYDSIQIGYAEKKEKNTSSGELGHFKNAKTTPKKKLKEFRNYEVEAGLGDTIECDIFEEGEKVTVVGISKGKGFQGVVKRHGFAGVGDATHGQHNRLRAPGAIGMASTPSKVLKGIKMAGRTGGDRVKVKNLNIVKILKDKNLILVSGAVPGSIGSMVIIEN